jgi:hypothetical protein
VFQREKEGNARACGENDFDKASTSVLLCFDINNKQTKQISHHKVNTLGRTGRDCNAGPAANWRYVRRRRVTSQAYSHRTGNSCCHGVQHLTFFRYIRKGATFSNEIQYTLLMLTENTVISAYQTNYQQYIT